MNFAFPKRRSQSSTPTNGGKIIQPSTSTRLTLNQKITFGICLIVIALMVSVIGIGNVSITNAMTKKISHDLIKAKEVFEFFQQSRFEELLIKNHVLVEVPQLKAVVTTGDIDYATIFDTAQSVQLSVKSDLFMLLDAQGKLLASVSEPGRQGEDLSLTPAFQNILQGKEYLGLMDTDKGIYQVVASPFIFSGNVVGVLLAGYAINQTIIDKLAEMTSSHVLLVTKDRLIKSSNVSFGALNFFDIFFSSRTLKVNEVISEPFDNELYLLLTIPLDKIPGGYVLAQSLDQELLFFYQLQRWLILLGLISLVVAITLGAGYSVRITRPIEILLKQVKRIAQGDLSAKVDLISKDEIGDLAQAFNEMTIKLKQSYEGLEEKILQRTNELQKTLISLQETNEELKQTQAQLFHAEKMATVGQLAAGVAHEINNPVGFISNNMQVLQEYIGNYTKILGVVENIKRQVENGDAEKTKTAIDELKKLEEDVNLEFMANDVNKLLEQSVHGLERVRKIVLDLKTFAYDDKTEAKEAVKIEEIIDSILSIVKSELKAKAELIKDYGDTPVIQCNPQRTGQVFINLLVNAAQAIKERGKIVIKTYRQDQFVCVDVSDTGKGIPPENIKQIFDPFFTTKPVGQGTGLGLSVSYEIIKKCGGEIKVRSTVGAGTTFTVMLPIVQSPVKHD